MHLGLHAKYLIFWPILNKFGISQSIVMKAINIKFYRNPPSCSCADTRGEMSRQTEMTKLVRAFRNYANVHKSDWNIYIYTQVVSY
jgi:hypothetical protein